MVKKPLVCECCKTNTLDYHLGKYCLYCGRHIAPIRARLADIKRKYDKLRGR